MKKLHGLLAILGLAIALALSTGCTTIKTADGASARVVDTNLVDRGAIFLKGVANSGALIAVRYDRNAESYLRLAADTIDGALLTKDLSAATIEKSLSKIPVKELHAELAAAGVITALTAYDAFFANHVKGAVGENYIAATLLAAVRDGIRNAIGAPSAKTDELRQIVREEIRSALLPQYGGSIDLGIYPQIPVAPIDYKRLVQVPYVTTEDRHGWLINNGWQPFGVGGWISVNQ